MIILLIIIWLFLGLFGLRIMNHCFYKFNGKIEIFLIILFGGISFLVGALSYIIELSTVSTSGKINNKYLKKLFNIK